MDTARTKHGAATCTYLDDNFYTSPGYNYTVCTWATCHFANLKSELAIDVTEIESEHA